MSIDTGVNPKPEVVTNRFGKTVAGALQSYWGHLIANLREPPRLAIATAYFNPGGFRLLADQLEEARGVRLLLGAEPDVADDLRRIRALRHDVLPEEAPRERLRQALREHHQLIEEDRDLSAFDPATDALIERLIKWLRSEQVEVRRLSRRFLHGKAYIVETGPDGVLAGSSNLTHAGLTSNVELNLGNYQPGVVGEVLNWFDELWNEAEAFDLAGLYEERFKQHTPYEIYLRMLWERYRGEIGREEPKSGLHLTAFQRDGLYRALDYLARHSGVMIADGVGLGKTYLAGELLRQAVQERRQRALLVAPAALRDGPWETFLRNHDLKSVQCVSYQQLAADPRLGGTGERILWHDPDDYALVVIDEAHAYRNPETDRSATLRRFLEGAPRKDVVLLTATPVNNSLWDLYHLLSYFVRNDAQFISAGIPSLRQHFHEAEAEDPNDLSPDKLFDVLDAVAVRRTRRFVKKFYPYERIRKGDVELAITFPQPVVKRVDYDLSGKLPDYFARFAYAIGVDPADDDSPLPSPTEFEYGEQLSLARYVPTAYLKDEDVERYELQAAGLLRSGLLKRFESSVHAFARTCRKMAESHDAFLSAMDEGWVLTGDALAAWRKSDSDEFDPTELAEGRPHVASDFDVAALREAVAADRDLLVSFAEEAERINQEQDPKLDQLIEQLAAIAEDAGAEATDEFDERDKRKVIVFSYFADTVEWIMQRLESAVQTDERLAAYRGRIVCATGSTGDTDDVLLSFAPVSSDAPPGHPDRYDLLISTDVLAEGVNLQQARHIINYDLPWNPMRLVQRHGRIDRIGSPHKRVFLRCFFPSRELNHLLGLEETLQRKITQAAKTIGVEGEIVPGSKTEEHVFTHTQDQIRQLLEEDPSLFEEGMEAGALSGEEFRQELASAMLDAELRRRIVELPWTSGSGKATDGPGGFVFCARVGDDPNPKYRFVPINDAGEIDGEGLVADTLACLAKSVSQLDTARTLPNNLRRLAYEAWTVARRHILLEWERSTDPRNLQPAIPKAMRDAAAILRANRPERLTNEQFHILLDTVEAPYDTRTQRMIRRAINDHAKPEDQVAAIMEVVESLGLQPPEPIEPLPEIAEDDVHLVCWLGLVSEERHV